MWLLFLTDFSWLWRSPVAVTRRSRFPNFEICDLLSPNQKKPVLQDFNAVVNFSAIQALMVNVDDNIDFFPGNMIILSDAGPDGNVDITGTNLFPR